MKTNLFLLRSAGFSRPILRSAGFSRPHCPSTTGRLKPALRKTLLFTSLLLAPAHAQSPADFAAPPAPTPPTQQTDTAATTPSRMVDISRIDAYTASLAAVFSMRNRELDPFGHSQDPEAKPIIKESTNVARRVVRQETPFADIVQLITVNAIMPGDQSFLVGSRTVKAGDELPLVFRGKSIRVKVTAVTARRIVFENLENGETAARELQLMPAGMERGAGAFTAPGMVADTGNAPLELDAGAPAN